MKISTTIRTMKKVWNELKEMKLEGLLTGEKTDLDPTELFEMLLNGGKLNKLCQLITKSDIDFEEYEIEEVAGMLQDFFGHIMQAFGGSIPRQANQVNQQAETPSI